MEKKYLIVNVGSTSKRYALFSYKEIFNAHFKKYGNKYLLKTSLNERQMNINKKDYLNSSKYLLKILKEKELIEGLETVGVRIVAPGLYFLENKIIDKQYLEKLKEVLTSAPLHISPALDEIINLQKLLPKIKLFGISDSAFHKTINENAKIYGLNNNETKKLELYKYGYHGISINSIISKLKVSFEEMPNKIIICHLGGGCSITAIKDQKSFDTSMGYTPLEGLYGSTRVGDIDVGAAIYLGKKLKLNYEELEEYFNKQCGFYGIGGSSDVKELLKSKNKEVKLTIESFVYKIKKYIGSYAAVLNGVELIVFTGAIGFNSAIIREKICKDLDYLGLKLDENKNNKIKEDGYIQSSDSKVKLLIIKTDEMHEMLKEIRKIID